ncbi:MAG TPA: HNH endonuclease [Thermotogaceae bacterium]|nr:HNH endonuclease [Thermotogaceae bacterium]
MGVPKYHMVLVVDAKGRSLLPTHPARARKLLKQGKAKVYKMVPFTIQLRYEVKEPKGEFTIGIDDGAEFVGIAVKGKDKIIFATDVRLRQDVKRKIDERRMYRRNRRNRKLRYRPARFLNRRRPKGWMPPSVKYRKDVILRAVDDLRKYMNMTRVVVELGWFDTSSMACGRKLKSIEYQQPDFEGRNRREQVLWRDGYKCQHCGTTIKLQIHHIIPRNKGGTDTLNNLITLCAKCHKELHEGKWVLKKKPKQYKYPAILQQGKWYLYEQLVDRFGKENVKVTFGWITSKKRKELGLEKDHWLDACSILNTNKIETRPFLIIPKRRRKEINNPTKKHETFKGFKHWDLVKAVRSGKKMVGVIRSLKKRTLTLRTSFDDNFEVSYSKTKLLWRPQGLVYILM